MCCRVRMSLGHLEEKAKRHSLPAGFLSARVMGEHVGFSAKHHGQELKDSSGRVGCCFACPSWR